MLAVYDLAGRPLPDGAEAALGLPEGDATRLCVALCDDGAVRVEEIPVRALPMVTAVPALAAVTSGSMPAFRRPPDSLRVWALAARLGLRLVAEHRIAPDLRVAGDTVVGTWRALPDDDPDVAAAVARLGAVLPPAAFAAVREDGLLHQAADLVRTFLDAVADTAVRHGGPPPRAGRPRERLLPWTARWSEALADPENPAVPLRDDAHDLVAGVSGWLAGGSDGAAGLLEIRLDAPEEVDAPWMLRFALRTEDGRLLPAANVWDRPSGDPEAASLQEALLRGLGRCARAFPPLDRALHDASPTSQQLDITEAWRFLSEAEPLLRGGDVVVVLPDDVAEHSLRLRVRVGVDDEVVDADDEDAAATLIGDAAFAWEVALDDEPLEDWELDAITAASAPLVRWRDRWVRVDAEQLDRVRGLGGGGRLGIAEALVFALGGAATVGEITGEADTAGPWTARAAERVDVVAEGRIGRLLERLREAAERPPVAVAPPGFVGELRPYQQRGVSWLQGMGSLGLGAVLADDMGLGKGIQLIAYLLARRRAGESSRPSLVVCPTSVVGNWQRELAKFAPELPVTGWHGADRPDDPAGLDGVVVTTYGTLRRDVEALAAARWDVVTLDEAQHVKNPQTAGAKAVRRLRRRQTVALTGTPLENRLGELWAVLDVTNPGLVGTESTFNRRFVVPVERRHDRTVAARLRRLVAPFVLRREKSDPSVIADLPPKIERIVACPLTAEQAELYSAAVERVLGDGALASATAMQRRGRVLALLTELKQICNHPAQALAEDASRLGGRSGKLAAAREIVGAAADAGEQVLVFTQYVAMGRLLVEQFADDLGSLVPFLHGGVAAGARDRMVADFQGGLQGRSDAPPVLVVSLRAGGTGLNLTAATHVLHYDRWWNPAVEDQATDRAHRIGQTRTVEVHKLVTAGTVEERIADLLESKRALARQVVGAGEAWITELDDESLRDLVALSAKAEVTELDDDEVPSMAGAGS